MQDRPSPQYRRPRPQVATLEHPFIVPHIESWIHATHTVKIVYGYCEQGDLSNFVRLKKKKASAVASCARVLAARACPC